MKNKLLTALLVAAIIILPDRIRADGPEKENTVAVCAVVAMGTIAVIALWYACKKIPPPPGTCPCGCGVSYCSCTGSGNAPEGLSLIPPAGAIVTNPPAAAQAGTKLQYDGFTPFGPGSLVDDQGRPWNYSAAFSFSLQSSVDLINWQYALTVNGWLTTDSGALFAIRSNGVTLANAYFTNARSPTNGLPLDLPGGQKRFYRIACQ